MPDEVLDQTQTDVTDKDDTTSGADDKTVDTDADDKTTETDTADEKDDSGKDRAASDFINKLLDTYNVSTPEELNDFIGELSGVKDALGDEDIEELLENKKLLLQYHAKWAADEETRLRETETPEETIARLEKDLKKEKDATLQERQREKEARENKRLIDTFNTFVTKNVDALKIGDHLKGHLKKYLGVNNPIHDIDLSNKVGIKKMISEAGKAMQDLEQTILKTAKVKVADIPKMDDSTPPDASTDKPEEQPKNLAEARKRATAVLKEKLMRR